MVDLTFRPRPASYNESGNSTCIHAPDENEDEKLETEGENNSTDYNISYESLANPPSIIKEYIGDSRFLVGSFENELDDPKNWTYKKKIIHTMMYGITTFVSQYNSAAMAPMLSELQSNFNLSYRVAALATCLYILGIGLGPVLFAPLSEVYGRKLSTFVPFLFAGVLNFASAYSYNFCTFLFFRFLCGVFSAAPIVIGGGMLADIWEPSVRGNYTTVYSNFVTMGPCFAPLIGGAILQAFGWRAILIFTCILYLIVGTLNLAFVQESQRSVLLAREAKKLRVATGNRLYYAEMDLWGLTFKEFMQNHVTRPLKMLKTPIIFSVALYASFVFGIFYLIATSVTTTFKQNRDWGTILASSPMISVYFGATAFGIPINVVSSKRYRRRIAKNGGIALPEERLFIVMILSFVLPAGIILFGLTVGKLSWHWLFPCLGLMLIGAGFATIFQGCLNYLVDAYPKYSASGLAVNTCLRSLVAGCLPIFSQDIFKHVGVERGSLGIAGLALLCVPIPFILYFKGAKARLNHGFT